MTTPRSDSGINELMNLGVRTGPLSQSIGLGLVAGVLASALVLACLTGWQASELSPALQQALNGGWLAAASTALGAALVLVMPKASARFEIGSTALGAGIMLAAAMFALLLPALQMVTGHASEGWRAVATALVLLVVLGGAWAMHGVQQGLSMPSVTDNGPAAMLVLAVCLHNAPEGFAIGVDALTHASTGYQALTLGIALQDLPEGWIVASALAMSGMPRWKAFSVGVFSGLIEPVAAAGGVALAGSSMWLLPVSLAFGAGAMLFVVVHLLVPQIQASAHRVLGSAAMLIGVVLMIWLDVVLQ
jgi:ZIP family zinc transporter